MKLSILIGIGGAIGATARYGVSWATGLWWTEAFPLATLIANCLGCFLLAYFSKALLGKVEEILQKAITTGAIGSFTTFSAFSVETVRLFQLQQIAAAFFYVLISLAAGLFFLHIGEKKGGSAR